MVRRVLRVCKNIRTKSRVEKEVEGKSEENMETEDISISPRNDDADICSGAIESDLMSSIFSKGKMTYKTDESSSISEKMPIDTRMQTIKDQEHEFGRPLRIVEVSKERALQTVCELGERDDTVCSPYKGSDPTLCELGEERRNSTHSSRRLVQIRTPTLERIELELRILQDSLDALMDDVRENITSISKAAIQVIEYFKRFLPNTDKTTYRFSMANSSVLRSITKVVLHFQDNLLRSDVFSNSRAILLKRYAEFLRKLNAGIVEENIEVNYFTQPSINIYAIGEDCNLPNKEKISSIIDELTKMNNVSICDQEGSFVAPLLRGVNKNISILSIMFGFPNPQQEHYEMVNLLFSLFPDVHFYCVKDYITSCAAEVSTNIFQPSQPMQAITTHTTQFIPPYKLPTDVMAPPISMSLSAENSLRVTGTLGGYLYPQINENNRLLSQFANATYAITCAHVVLTESQDHPSVSTPSTVLQNSYKQALYEESKRYPEGSVERDSFLKEILRIDENLAWQQKHKFGQVVWGERSIVNKKLSDFAIIKVNAKFRCQNYLGDDLTGIPDPALRFKNLYVKKAIACLTPGMDVFKIGASSKYTGGNVNGSKIVYWADGKLQSSEFIVSSPQPFFATGGDSGSWILTKLNKELGLGVVGMLHSYDGERKQIGLFTSISDILNRLQEVTGVAWCINQHSHSECSN